MSVVQAAIIRLLLVEDHEVVRRGTRQLLEAEPDLVVVGEAVDAEAAVRLANQHWPDVVLLDLRLAGGSSGLKAARIIARDVPRVAILVLTVTDEPEYARAALEAGVQGYLLKNAAGAEIISAIRRTHAGERVLDPVIANALSGRPTTARPNALEELSKQERLVFRLLGRGMSNSAISSALGISARTVEGHVAHILQKLGLPSRAEAICYAARYVLSRHGSGPVY